MLNFTVGPVMSSEEILEVASHSAPYFRTPEFSAVMLENERFMLDFLDAPENSRCVFLTASGTGAMESVVMNVLDAQDNVIVINGGSFGQRFVDLCRLHARSMAEIRLPFGQGLKKEQLLPYAGKGFTALLVNMHETSSGVLYDMPAIAAFCKENGILLVIDAISAFIADELDMRELGAAVVITGSQKALAVQPGVSAAALSPEALKRVEEHKEICMYLSLKEALKNAERGQTPFTPAVTTLLQIQKRLQGIQKKGGISVERSIIAETAAFFRRGISDLPLESIARSCSNAVTALRPIHGSAKEIIQRLKEDHKIWVCPNGGEWADQIFRVGHIGNITQADNQKLIDALHEIHRAGVY